MAAKSESEKFSGFSPEGMRFLENLKKNNDREWFRERKALYDELVHRPMELLVTEAAAACRKRGLMVAAKEKQPVMRVYRDIRFSPDKRPFKTHVSAGLKPTGAPAGELYIHISPKESFVAAGFWMPERPLLQAWRASLIEDDGKRFLQMTKKLGKAGLELSTENQLKRLPRGYDRYAESAVAAALRLTSYVSVRDLQAEECRSAGLVGMICDFGLAVKPLLEYGWRLNVPRQQEYLRD